MTKICLKDLFIFSLTTIRPEGIEWFTEDKAFAPSYDLASSSPISRQQVVSLFHSSFMSPVVLTGGGPRGSQNIRWRESLDLYKSFNTLWIKLLIYRITLHAHAVHCTSAHPFYWRKSPSKRAPYCIINYEKNVRNIFTIKNSLWFFMYCLFYAVCILAFGQLSMDNSPPCTFGHRKITCGTLSLCHYPASFFLYFSKPIVNISLFPDSSNPFLPTSTSIQKTDAVILL